MTIERRPSLFGELLSYRRAMDRNGNGSANGKRTVSSSRAATDSGQKAG